MSVRLNDYLPNPTSRLKILHVASHYGERGGAEQYLLDICSALADAGCDVSVVAASRERTASESPIKVTCLPPVYGFRSVLSEGIRKYRELIEKERPDVIHVHNTQYHINPLILLALSRRVPTIKFVHDVQAFCPSGLKLLTRTNSACVRPMGRRCWNAQGCLPFAPDSPSLTGSLSKFTLTAMELRALKRFDRLVVGSNYMAGELVRNGVTEDRITVLPNFTTMREVRLEKPDDPPTILCLAQFNRVKGMRELIEALARLSSQPWRAKLIGDGALRDDCVRMVSTLGLAGRVDFISRLPHSNLARLLCGARMLVVPSLVSEAFGLVGIEALACATPVVAFDSGGIGEWCIDGETGIVVTRGDVASLSRAMRKLLDNSEHARRLGERGRILVDKRFRVEAHLEGLLDVYQTAIGSRKTDPRGRQSFPL